MECERLIVPELVDDPVEATLYFESKSFAVFTATRSPGYKEVDPEAVGGIGPVVRSSRLRKRCRTASVVLLLGVGTAGLGGIDPACECESIRL